MWESRKDFAETSTFQPAHMDSAFGPYAEGALKAQQKKSESKKKEITFMVDWNWKWWCQSSGLRQKMTSRPIIAVFVS